jgi:hypothetical protein
MDNENVEVDSKSDGETLEQFLENMESVYETKIEEIKKELEDVFTIDEFNLVEENMKTVSRLHLWLSRLVVEKRKLLKIKRKRDDIYSKLYEDFRTGKRGVVSLTEKGIDARINLDGTYKRYNAICEEQENVVYYIDQLCWALKQSKMNALKNILDSKRIEGS